MGSDKGYPKTSSKRSALVWSLTTLAVLVALKTTFEHTAVVEYLENKTYEFLQGRIVSGGVTERPKVLVVDISSIKKEPCSPGWECTPRRPIQDLIEVFTEMGAKSVGVDVDFSPDKGQLIHPKDRDFFESCLQRSIKTQVPIVLGVFRTAERPEEWLSDDRYMRLAGFIGVRRQGDYWPDRATYWTIAGNGMPLRSMSAALAGVDWASLIQGSNSPWSWAIRPTSIIDFSSLNRIQDEVEHHVDPSPYRDDRDKISGRMVILGDAAQTDCNAEKDQDCFHVTGVKHGVPGVYLHACAAATISSTKPIYQLTLLGRIVMDVLLAFLVFGLAEISSWRHRHLGDSIPHLERRLSIKFTFLMVVVVLIGSTLLVRWTKVLWTDFILVCLVLIVQLAVEIFHGQKHADASSFWTRPLSKRSPAKAASNDIAHLEK